MAKVSKNLHNERINYDKSTLHISQAKKNPFKQFDLWYHEAAEHGGFEANAMTLSTVDAKGVPSSRVVLLKEYSNEGLVFFTNYMSQKGEEMLKNDNVSLLFFYEQMQRQIRITGKVQKLSDQESEAYFNTRPIESQYGAMLSNQSHRINSKEELEQEFNRLLKSNKKTQRPKHWGGYIVKPSYFEFWQGRPNRMHDRISYAIQKDSWSIDLLSP